MSKIRILSDALASQVAAGEVVERPASVLRELIDNSLDAGASQVQVEIQSGGSALIRVTDNGSGMGREDAMLCIERHATSKIRTKEDLGAIETFGFRGEALPSIASVSRFRLATREREALVGTEIEIHGGKLAAVRESGGAPGTMVEVRSLFFNVPARRKFLRAETTEYAHVEQQFRLHAIANPQVAFSLTKDGALLYHLPAEQDLLQRIRGLVGDELAQRLLPVGEVERLGVQISGFVGGPGYSRSNKQLQLTFLNGRCVESAPLLYGLREGYHTTLMKGQYPVTFLFLRMDPHAFDVNVHPAKKEVRFYDGHAVREAIARAVQDTLNQSRALPIGHAPLRSAAPLSPMPTPVPPLAIERQESLAIQVDEQRQLRRDWSELPAQHHEKPTEVVHPERAQVEPAAMPESKALDAPAMPPDREAKIKTPEEEFRILGVLGKLYVLMEGSEGLVLMDQHAAHERVLFEQMRRSMENEGVPTQRLLMPLMLHVSPRDYELLCRNLEALAKLGIEAEPFGANTLKVDALPTFLKTDDPASLLSQVVDELSGLSSRTSTLRLGEDMIATTVCRHAVKANDHLRQPEISHLVRDLMACEMPYCCPHGRPTLIQISYSELEKKFGRRAP